MPNGIDLLDLLKGLVHQYVNRQSALDEADDDDLNGIPDNLIEAFDEVDNALIDVLRWVSERTGIARDDLREAAFRGNTAFGLEAHVQHERQKSYQELLEDPTSPDGFRVEIRTQPRRIVQHRDLRWIAPKLAELARDPATPARLAAVMQQHPKVMQAIGLNEFASLPTADGPSGLKGSPSMSKEVPWDESDRNYEAMRPLLGRYSPQPMSESEASRKSRPDGPWRYMRKTGIGCRIHVNDFEEHLKAIGAKTDARAMEHAIEYLAGVEATKREVRSPS